MAHPVSVVAGIVMLCVESLEEGQARLFTNSLAQSCMLLSTNISTCWLLDKKKRLCAPGASGSNTQSLFVYAYLCAHTHRCCELATGQSS